MLVCSWGAHRTRNYLWKDGLPVVTWVIDSSICETVKDMQLVINPEKRFCRGDGNGRKLRSEFVIEVTGQVAAREQAMTNWRLERADWMYKTTPFEGWHWSKRWYASTLPLPWPTPSSRDARKSKLHSIRNYLDDLIYSCKTPFSKSTPEGARDYLVPSRVNKGHLRTSSKSADYKTVIDECWFDRYYQIVKCFRDEYSQQTTWIYQVDLET